MSKTTCAFEILPLPVYLATAPTEGLEHWKRRAPLGLPRRHVDGRHLQPGRRQAPGRSGRARTGAESGAPCRAVPGAVGLAADAAGAGLEGDGAQLGPRFHLCLFGGRCGRCRHAPLRGSAHDRRRSGGAGGQVVGRIAGRTRLLRPQCVQPHPVGRGRIGGRSDGSTRSCRAGAVGAHRPSVGRRSSTPTRCGRCSACCRARRSTATSGCTTSSSKRTRRVSASPSRWVRKKGRDVPIARAKQDIYARLDARPDAVIRFGLDQPPTRRIAARVARGARLRMAAVRTGGPGPSGRGR